MKTMTASINNYKLKNSNIMNKTNINKRNVDTAPYNFNLYDVGEKLSVNIKK